MAGPISVILCEFATIHSDSTFAIVRGGIEHWTSALPLTIGLSVFVQVERAGLAVGKHDISMDVITPNGLTVGQVAAQLEVTNQEFPIRFVLPLQASIQSYGIAVVRIHIGNLESIETQLNVKAVN